MKAAVCLSDCVFPTHCRWTMSQRTPAGQIMEDVHTSASEILPATHALAQQAPYYVMMDAHVIQFHQHISFLQQEALWPGYRSILLSYGTSHCQYRMFVMPSRLTSTGEIRRYITQTCFSTSSGKTAVRPFTSSVPRLASFLFCMDRWVKRL